MLEFDKAQSAKNAPLRHKLKRITIVTYAILKVVGRAARVYQPANETYCRG